MAPKRRISPTGGQPRQRPVGASPFSALLYAVAIGISLFIVGRHADSWSRYTRYLPVLPGFSSLSKYLYGSERPVQVPLLGPVCTGHADFGDGRAFQTKRAFCDPESEALYYVNVMLGNGGPEPNLSGGMIPSVAPPFGMTRWTPQTRQNYVSMCPYNQTDTHLHGFIGTHQPAVWMGESGPAQIAAGLGRVVTDFDRRGLPFDRKDEYASANYYRNVLKTDDGAVEVEMSATSRVGHLRFTFHSKPGSNAAPHIVLDGSRASIITSNATNITYPAGSVTVDKAANEVYGWSTERQDHILVGDELPATNFKGYFVARFDAPISRAGTSRSGKISTQPSAEGREVSGWVTFESTTTTVNARVGVSFISVEQARKNLELEIPDSQSLEDTSRLTRTAWADKLDRLSIEGATEQNLTVAYTGFAHTLVYPYEMFENTGTAVSPKYRYYSGYLDAVVDGVSYTGYSIWDTFRAATAWQLFTALERVPDMITSMLQDYIEGGWLPMWKNIVETNIMVGTHADSIIAQAMKAGVTGFDYSLAWEAVKKNAYVAPADNEQVQHFDREEHTGQEVRAGLATYMDRGYVAADEHAESGSRTLDYAYDDHAAAIVATVLNDRASAKELARRAQNYKTLWNGDTGFMEARFLNRSFAGPEEGWTEGDHWAYTLNVMHDVPGLIALMGGKEQFIDFLDRHFDGGHNLHTNEPSHHIPYLYAWAEPAKAQEWVRRIGREEYNHTDIGLSGNEDCGQMSAWYLFSMLGFYPVDPAGAVYVIGSPYFDHVELELEGSRKIVVDAKGASSGKEYVRGVRINGEEWNNIHVDHARLVGGAEIVFDMADTPQSWP